MTDIHWVRADWFGFHKVAAALVVVASLAASCGGQAEGGEGPSPHPSPTATATGGSGGATGGSGGTPRNGTALGDCVLGFDRNDEPARPCAWVGDGLCYDTKPAACACICPRNRTDSVCSSSFDDGPDGRVEVHCS